MTRWRKFWVGTLGFTLGFAWFPLAVLANFLQHTNCN